MKSKTDSLIKLCVICSLVILPYCSNDLNYFPDDIKTYSLKGEKMQFQDVYCPSSIILFDSLICIKDQCSDRYFHFFNTETYEKVIDFGSTGKGPGEYAEEPYILSQEYHMGRKYLTTWDQNDFGKSIRIKDIIDGKHSEFQTFKVPPVPFLQGIYMLDQTTAIVTSESPKGRAVFCDFSKNEYHWIHEHAKVKIPNVSKENRDLLDYEFLTISPQGDRIAANAHYLARVTFYDRDFNIIKSYQKNNVLDKIRTKRDYVEWTPCTFGQITSTESKVYALEHKTKMINSGRDYDVMSSSIYVFSWEGSLLCKYDLDFCMRHIIVDEKTKMIYGIDRKEGDIVRFSMVSD